MKILLVANINSSHTKKWALALKSQNVQVALFSINVPVLDDNWYSELNDVYYPDKVPATIISKYLRLYFSLKKMIAGFQPDILHSHFITNYSFLSNSVGFKKHIITAWGSDVFIFPKENFLTKWIIKYNLKKADAIISTSHVMAKEISLYTDKKIKVIPFGIDFSLFKTKPSLTFTKNKTVIIGCVKKIEKIYATEILLKAFHLLKNKLKGYDLKLILAGNGSRLDEMKLLARQLNIEQQVEFLGWVNSGQIPELLEKIDICVYLSRNESFGVSLIEAMASKIPLVVTKTPGFLEVTHNQNNALFVEFDNPEQTAEKITELILNSEHYKLMVENSYNTAFENYQLNNNIRQQIEFYKEILG